MSCQPPAAVNWLDLTPCTTHPIGWPALSPTILLLPWLCPVVCCCCHGCVLLCAAAAATTPLQALSMLSCCLGCGRGVPSSMVGGASMWLKQTSWLHWTVSRWADGLARDCGHTHTHTLCSVLDAGLGALLPFLQLAQPCTAPIPLSSGEQGRPGWVGQARQKRPACV